MFKPQHPYESSLRERCKDVPATAMNLLEDLLSIEPHKRGTSSSALVSEVMPLPTKMIALQFQNAAVPLVSAKLVNSFICSYINPKHVSMSLVS